MSQARERRRRTDKRRVRQADLIAEMTSTTITFPQKQDQSVHPAHTMLLSEIGGWLAAADDVCCLLSGFFFGHANSFEHLNMILGYNGNVCACRRWIIFKEKIFKVSNLIKYVVVSLGSRFYFLGTRPDWMSRLMDDHHP